MWYNRDVITILDFSREELEEVFETADDMLKYSHSRLDILKGKVMALAFFEPSTRTRLSFETAMIRLGGDVIGFSEVSTTSIAKGETLADTIRMLDSYADIIVIRHSIEGAAKFAAEIAESPVINAGDGTRHHPTQAMIDLYTIRRNFEDIDGLTIGVLGDLKYGRAATSFIYGVSLYNIKKLYLISPPLLSTRKEVRDHLKLRGIAFEEVERLDDVIEELDVLYVTRIQRERFPDPAEYEKVRGSYRVTPESLKKVKRDLIILHPLPRVDELHHEVDRTKHAKYFEQARYGVPVRMALLKLILAGDRV
ncbi:MAG: aspartate carbamoyltransferase [Thermoprotei archaeon]|nr:MAG: aspartate carbamoyltransferase [Thermoprotei archaeon]RLF24714.1 MAG: aspartate carbamoyltransferase [Thermoprotei archaeon]